jgi:hypothetical protein
VTGGTWTGGTVTVGTVAVGACGTVTAGTVAEPTLADGTVAAPLESDATPNIDNRTIASKAPATADRRATAAGEPAGAGEIAGGQACLMVFPFRTLSAIASSSSSL